MVKLNEETRAAYSRYLLELLEAEQTTVFRLKFLDLHPVDQVEVFQQMDQAQKEKFYKLMTPSELADIFEELELEEQKDVVNDWEDQEMGDVFNHMNADDVADFLGELQEDQRQGILTSMDDEDAKDVQELLTYEEETAGAIMTKEIVNLHELETVHSVLDRLRNEAPDAEMIYYLYVVDEEEKLTGVVSLRDLMVAQLDAKIGEVMSRRVVSVHVNEDQEDVAQLIKKYDFLAVPVVSTSEELLGIVTVDDVMDVLEEEATEDLAEFSATRGATDVNITAFQAAKKRSPWIILLMLFGMITAGIIGSFEETLEQVVLLSAFIPMLMGSAGNVGTQSLAIVVRGLALGNFEKKGLMRALVREFGTGLLIGLSCAIVLLLIIPIFFDDSLYLAGIVGVSLLVSLAMAAVVGSIVPLVINKFKLDPAIASGPFITTFNDIVSITIYFSIATTLLQFL
ncbi:MULTISPECIES: magnesium transporter [Geomicrobium]|uniref:Magnesium transporter MgtE n=1 Tax=Geomicrobium sediminis TaxID=1347788 RepID=A0ABS2P856_9BACL|nr:MULTISPECIES: magnesium transporter [Geomicrobium]MBM7631598.1 magnesium transporter [Geomicrobium sediminis]GAK09351.1 Mg/Co/Ni transporter MgtE [Geomicrobium sp. JCM 19038]